MLQDSSGSIQPPDWMDSKEFLVNVLDQFTNIEAKVSMDYFTEIPTLYKWHQLLIMC